MSRNKRVAKHYLGKINPWVTLGIFAFCFLMPWKLLLMSAAVVFAFTIVSTLNKSSK